MATFFLSMIYMAFISLGLPDSLLGVAWPLMRSEYGAPFEAAGLVSLVIAASTVVSSLASGAVHRRLGTGQITALSCLMTALALLGFGWAPSYLWLLFLAIPLGLGAGSVDSALNNYVATHYKVHHMSWLHCFWGVGATLGPIIMARFIGWQNSWRQGYQAIGLIQFALVILLFSTLPLWKRMAAAVHNNPAGSDTGEAETNPPPFPETAGRVKPLHIKGVKLALLSFLFYCGAEATMGLWGSSFLVAVKELPAAVAAQWVSLYYAGITVGRLMTGFMTWKIGKPLLIRLGQLISLAGAALLSLPLPAVFSLAGFILVGLGCAPVFPCMLHETPTRFGRENSQRIMGYQMALAYTGSTFLPPLFGLVAAHTAIGLFPYFVVANILLMLAASEKINLLMQAKKTPDVSASI